jgi:ABC-type transporter Mla MlaB component
MEQDGERPRAVVVLVRDGEQVLLGPVYGPDRCDLAFVEGLLRVQLTARRFGWSIKLTEVRDDLRELVELVGLTTDLVG